MCLCPILQSTGEDSNSMSDNEDDNTNNDSLLNSVKTEPSDLMNDSLEHHRNSFPAALLGLQGISIHAHLFLYIYIINNWQNSFVLSFLLFLWSFPPVHLLCIIHSCTRGMQNSTHTHLPFSENSFYTYTATPTITRHAKFLINLTKYLFWISQDWCQDHRESMRPIRIQIMVSVRSHSKTI